MVAVLGAIRIGRIIRTMGIIQVKPEEKRTARSFIEPRDSMGHAFFRFSVHQAQFPMLKSLGGESVIVKIEAARQSPTAVKDKGTHHRPGGVTLLFEGLRNRAESRVQGLASEVLHAVLERIHAG